MQSQSQQAHSSVPFSWRQLRRECASFTLSSPKYSSQYGRSSASGGSQKQVSTQIAVPDLSTRVAHVVQILVSGDGAAPERTVVDRADERTFLARFQLCFNEIPHVQKVSWKMTKSE